MNSKRVKIRNEIADVIEISTHRLESYLDQGWEVIEDTPVETVIDENVDTIESDHSE